MTRESVETRSKRKQRAATKREKKRKYHARQRKVAEVCKVLTDPHTARALREGITREEAKMRSFSDLYGGRPFGGFTTGRMSASGRNLSSIPRSLKSMPFWLPKNGEVPKTRFLIDHKVLRELYEHHAIGGKTHVACEALKKLAVDTETETFDPKNPNVFIGTDYSYGSVESRVMAMYSKIDAELTQGLVDVSWKGKRGRKKK